MSCLLISEFSEFPGYQGPGALLGSSARIAQNERGSPLRPEVLPREPPNVGFHSTGQPIAAILRPLYYYSVHYLSSEAFI